VSADLRRLDLDNPLVFAPLKARPLTRHAVPLPGVRVSVEKVSANGFRRARLSFGADAAEVLGAREGLSLSLQIAATDGGGAVLWLAPARRGDRMAASLKRRPGNGAWVINIYCKDIAADAASAVAAPWRAHPSSGLLVELSPSLAAVFLAIREKYA
jgi:hypothetical protein